MTSAVVFAYHDVGVRCLSVLLAHGIEIGLVVTHEDAPGENIWFGSVAALARRHRLPCIAPADARAPGLLERVRELAPDFLFSFYYRHMLRPDLLATARRGALNMHGSLLPKYRGRVPVNWAVLRGERETGATLHYMTAKPDDGPIVDQQAVPILPDDTAGDVFRKVTCAAEMVLDRSIGDLVAGTAPAIAQDASKATYFGGRKPEDGRIDWKAAAHDVHNLVRAVAPPYPGAFCDIERHRLAVHRTTRAPIAVPGGTGPRLVLADADCVAVCGDGATLRLDEFTLDGVPAGPDAIMAVFRKTVIPLA